MSRELRSLMSSSSFIDMQNIINNSSSHGHVHGPSCNHGHDHDHEDEKVAENDQDGSIGE